MPSTRGKWDGWRPALRLERRSGAKNLTRNNRRLFDVTSNGRLLFLGLLRASNPADWSPA
jgi:hypothetical protein